MRVLISSHSPLHLLWIIILNISHLVSRKWYLSVVLICISLVANNGPMKDKEGKKWMFNLEKGRFWQESLIAAFKCWNREAEFYLFTDVQRGDVK